MEFEDEDTDTFAESVDTAKEAESGAYFYVVLDCARPLRAPARFSLEEIDTVMVGRGGRRAVARGRTAGKRWLKIEIADQWLSTAHFRLRRKGRGGWLVEDAGSKNGTLLQGEPVQRGVLEDGAVVEAGSTLFLFRDGQPMVEEEPADLDGAALAGLPPVLVTLNPSLRHSLRRLERIASARVSVLVRGETGTGKELLAQTLHELSGRRGPLVAVNCGALPDTLIESELFGHRRGAFSGAVEDRVGLVRAADRGTLFLDEIAELSQSSQVALLRVLQESEVVPVGAIRAVPVDVLVVSATHQDLGALIGAGRFREDLLGRLSGFVTSLPPLRERREDLGLLIAHVVHRNGGGDPDLVRFQRAAGRALLLYHWPLNIRELVNAVTSALALSGGGEVTTEHLPGPLRWVLEDAGRRSGLSAEERALRTRLWSLLVDHQGNVARVAEALGKFPAQIRRWCKRFGIDVDRFRD